MRGNSLSKHRRVRHWQRGQSPGLCQSSAWPEEGEFLLVSSREGAQAPGWMWPTVPILPPCHPSSVRAPRGHKWGRNRGTEGCRHRVGPGRAPQGRAGRAKAEGGESGSSWGKGDTTEGHTASSSPTTPLDMVLPPWLVACLPPNITQGGQKSHPVSPHPQGSPRAQEAEPRQGSPGGCWCPRGPRHFWSVSASLWKEDRR